MAEGRPEEDLVEFACLGVNETSICARRLSDDRLCVIHRRAPWDWEVEGELLRVRPGREWTFGRTLHIAGEIVESRMDVTALNLTPLGLLRQGTWRPQECYEAEAWEALRDDPLFAPAVQRGTCLAYEMEQVIPGLDLEDMLDDPIVRAAEAHRAGDLDQAYHLLYQCTTGDLRCLDAHAHLGLFSFRQASQRSVLRALRHYQMGVAIADLTVGPDFGAVLPWNLIDNRPFLRCLHGLGLCWWRLGELDKARGTLGRLVWLDPLDCLGVRFLWRDISQGVTWAQSVESDV